MQSPEDADEIELRAAFAAMSEGVVVQLADGTIRSSNAAAQRILGLSADQLAGRTSLDPRWRAIREDGSAFEGSDHPAMVTLRTGEPQHGVLMGLHKADGSESWISISTAPLVRRGEHTPYAVVATFADVTEQRAMVAALRRQEEHFRLALAAARMGTWEWQVGGAVEWSSEVYEIFGVDRSGFDGSFEGYLALVHPAERDELAGTIQRALEEPERGDAFEVQHRVPTPSGPVRWVHCQGRVLRDAAGQPTRMIGTIGDVTRQVTMEAELARARRMESIGRLAGGIAHDFNNLLTAILASAELAMQRVGREHAAHSMLEIVQGASQQAARLTRQLLAFAREQPLELAVVSVDGLVEEVRPLLASVAGADVELEVRLGAGSAVHADRGQLEQVLVNLAMNAREAMPRGGRLSIETGIAELVAGAEPGLAPGRYVRLVVSDSGCGMSPEVVERAFDPFFTTKERGSGLGLATCYGIVAQLGGRVVLESQVGMGTQVTILLPERERGCATSSAPLTELSSLPRGQETLLLVEDEARVREATAQALRGLGYEVLTAGDADEAQRVAGASEREIDLLLSDIVLPGRSGLELAEHLTAARPSTAVLLVSGHAPESYLERGSARFARIAKPYSLATLACEVRRVLDARRAGASELSPCAE